jgi:hypothetical protein
MPPGDREQARFANGGRRVEIRPKLAATYHRGVSGKLRRSSPDGDASGLLNRRALPQRSIMTGPPFLAPEVQHVFRVARGAGAFRKQRPEGPKTPAFTKVNARHWFDIWQAKLQSTALSIAELLRSFPKRSKPCSKLKNLDWATA